MIWQIAKSLSIDEREFIVAIVVCKVALHAAYVMRQYAPPVVQAAQLKQICAHALRAMHTQFWQATW